MPNGSKQVSDSVSRRKYLLSAGVASSIGLAGCSSVDGGGNDDVANEVIITGPLDGWANYGQLRESFMEKHPNIEWPEGTKNSGQSLNALRNEANNPNHDVAHHGITDGLKAADEELLQPYEPANVGGVPDGLVDDQNRWTTAYFGTIAIAVNTELVDSVPSGFEDLLDGAYNDTISFYNPTSAFNGFVAFTNMNLAMGGSLDNYDPGIEYLNELYEMGNIAGVPDQGLQTSFLQGQFPIYIAYDFNMYQAKYQSDMDPEQVEIVIPSELSIQVPYVVGLVNDAPRPEAGKLLIDHHLSDEGQTLFAEAFVNPSRPIEYPDEIAEQRLPDSAYESSEAIDYQQLVEVQNAARERYVNEVA
ncbi:extracellular solute-binding protein [Halopenitus persicus]|uniref:extracellular solute-binding protein n=1 Tax=Halopenitus persicus TaxID=1048396 RepID=UPI000BBA7DC4|nr:extracellular solute-binding protein [Halopenitus persicus]